MNSKVPQPPLPPQPMSLLDDSQSRWCQGDWKTLCLIDEVALEPHPQRARIALLVAAAHHQSDHREDALRWSNRALAWGCTRTELEQLLIAGVHNTLGRCAALLGEQERATAHFRQAVGLSPDDDAHAGLIRCIHELTRLGLLNEAGNLIQQQLEHIGLNNLPSHWLETHLGILRTEMELLQCELILAQARGQLQRTAPGLNYTPSSLADAEAHWRNELQKKATSQLGQDIWVLERSAFKRGGFFVEFGATNGILLSNTYLLEKEFGWNGICAEPNPHFLKELKKNRLCIISDACISASTGEQVEFIFADVYGGMSRDAAMDEHKEKRDAYRNIGEIATLTTISLNDFLIAHNAPTTIDYLSIDTEGSEYSILETFPFDKWDLRLLTVEHNFTEQQDKIRRLLEGHGYICHEAHFDDWYYKP